MRILISNPTIINEGEQFKGSIVINNGRIAEILREGQQPRGKVAQTINAEGMFLIPGVIDDHVHFREPGLTEKATIYSESRAAAAGGVTSFMEMPNTKPQTTTITALKEKFAIAAKDSLINYSFYFGATDSNYKDFTKINPRRVCGIKLFMGSSTGNMLVSKREQLEKIFGTAKIPIAVHCEDSEIIARNTEKVKEKEGPNPSVEFHPVIRSNEACYHSTKCAIELAKEFDAKLNIMHISTKEELELLSSIPLNDKKITAEVTPAHLFFTSDDYKRLGTKIKCNPAIKSKEDRDALRKAINTGLIDVIGTDHAPHLPTDKVGGALTAASGMPTIQFSLLAMLNMVDEGIFSFETIVEKMCHAPAKIYNIAKRGFIKKGFYADFVLLSNNTPHTITKSDIISKCGWSPFEGEKFNWSVAQTWVNGNCVYKDGKTNDEITGKMLIFDR